MSEPLEWNDDDFDPATMEDDVIYIGTRKYVAEDTLHATVIEQQAEIERLREKMLELLTMLDYDKSSDRYRIAVDAAYEEFGQ